MRTFKLAAALVVVAQVVAPCVGLAPTLREARADGPGPVGSALGQFFGAPVLVIGTPTNGQVLTYSTATNTWAAGAGVSGIDLQTAYNNSADGIITLVREPNTNGLTLNGNALQDFNALSVTKNPASGSWDGNAVSISQGSHTSASRAALAVTQANTNGWAITMSGGGLIAASLASDPTSGANQGAVYTKLVAGVSQLFYEDSSGAVTQITSPGGVGSLQNAYTGGNTISEAGGNAVAISSTTADNGSVLTLTKNPAGAQSGVGLSVTMGANTTGNGITVSQSGSGLALLATGGSISSPGAGTNSERHGASAVAAGNTSAAFGQSASSGGVSSVAFGQSASSSGSNSVAIGQGVTATNDGCISIGVGSSSSGVNNSVAIGRSASATGSSAVAIGNQASAANTSIAIGTGSTATANGQFVAGSNGQAVTDVYFGKGVTNATPTVYTIHGTGATAASNAAGGGLTHQGGAGDGTGGGGLSTVAGGPSGAGANAASGGVRIDLGNSTGNAVENLDFYCPPTSGSGAGANTSVLQSRLTNKGSWVLNATGAVIAQSATDGFLYIPRCNTGAPSGVPTAQTGGGACVIGGDHHLYAELTVGSFTQVDVTAATPTLAAVINAANPGVVNGTAASGRISWTTGGTYSVSTAEILLPSDQDGFLSIPTSTNGAGHILQLTSGNGQGSGNAGGGMILNTGTTGGGTAAGGAFTVNIGADTGTNQNGSVITLNANGGTGNAHFVAIQFQSGAVGGSGSAGQTLTNIASFTNDGILYMGVNPSALTGGVADSIIFQFSAAATGTPAAPGGICWSTGWGSTLKHIQFPTDQDGVIASAGAHFIFLEATEIKVAVASGSSTGSTLDSNLVRSYGGGTPLSLGGQGSGITLLDAAMTGAGAVNIAGAVGSASAGSAVSLKAGNGAGTNQNGGGNIQGTGLPTGTGTANFSVQSGYTLASGTTLQTATDRFVIAGHSVTMSNTTATATGIVVLNVPTSNSGGGAIVKYTVIANDGTNWDTATGSFAVACSNKAGTVTATTSAITDEASNANSGTLTAGTTSATVAATAVTIKIAPAWTVITPTNVITIVTVHSFGNAVTITTQ